MSTFYENMLGSLIEYRRANPDASLQDQRDFATDKLQNEYDGDMTFGDGARIDNALFGFVGNKCWLIPHGNPLDGAIIHINNASLEAFNCGIFTFNVRKI